MFHNKCIKNEAVLFQIQIWQKKSYKNSQITQEQYLFPLIVKIVIFSTILSKKLISIIHLHIIAQQKRLSLLRINGQEFLRKDVYGMNDSVLGKKNASEKEPSRICLTNIIDTMVKPCQYVILCQDYCQNLRMTG
ncbi:unnamed protein product [Paramecium sonneborni]|uniref:Uncharacterized protein n=1 Tax=Paramecium sonneborni TaxID=65129 RepID=A0A8S1R0W4_9CILI|nr:unnamed protein product [Paramecium sonneborni]